MLSLKVMLSLVFYINFNCIILPLMNHLSGAHKPQKWI